MELKSIQKLTYSINTVILILVFGLAGFFVYCRAEFLIWFSIPTALVYVIGYFLIYKERLDIYVRMVYFWLTIYMSITTVCVGYNVGFHLYCLSMIPIIFYSEYMAERLGATKIDAFKVSGIIVICYLVSTGFVAFAGPIYPVHEGIAGVFWLFNSAIVLFFLITYSGIMLKMVGDSEKKLTDIAHTDRLTGLYNRHYMMTKLEEAMTTNGDSFLSMSDIDNFKQINDTYGHNAGDYILENLSKIMKEVCSDGEISRWGGEEFLIMFSGTAEDKGVKLIESLRKRIESEDFIFDGQKIDVTITSGIATFSKGQSVDEWIKVADDRLYYGKNNGKNRVVLNAEG